MPPVPEKGKMIKNIKKLTPDVLIAVQEIEICRSLACNDVVKRNKQLKKLRKWLMLRNKSSFQFIEEDFMRLWKGLYYNMWYSDKPLVQEYVAENTAKLLYSFEGNAQSSVQFFIAFLKTMTNEWFGIDQWRMDKFLMLVRRMLRHILYVLKSNKWPEYLIELFNTQTYEVLLSEEIKAKGLTLHYLDIFLEELAKVSENTISGHSVSCLLIPFAHYITAQKDFELIDHCRSRIFYHLLYQSSLGRDYLDKFNAWKEMGFPTASINDLELVEDEIAAEEANSESDTISQQELNRDIDPRAGNVDVMMPILAFDPAVLINVLETLQEPDMTIKRRKFINGLIKTLKTYQEGVFPLGVKKLTLPSQRKPMAPLVKRKVEDLEVLDNELYGVNRQLKKLNKRKRRRLLQSLNYDEITEDNLDETIKKQLVSNGEIKKRKRVKKNAKQCRLMNEWIKTALDKEDLIWQKKLEERSACSKETENKKSANEDNVAKNSMKVNNAAKIKILAKDGESCEQQSTKKKKVNTEAVKKELKKTASKSEWDEPLKEGEREIFIPFRKSLEKQAKSKAIIPLPLQKSTVKAERKVKKSSPVKSLKAVPVKVKQPTNAGCPNNNPKRVRIVLSQNTSQNPHEYIQQVIASPNVPYDATKKPSKSLLKPYVLPTPINPFYKGKLNMYLKKGLKKRQM